MYFPILRGRQNELLAVRELQDAGRLEHVTPIIEPVKASPTLLSVLERFRDCEKDLVLICDPNVGSFEKELIQSPDYAGKLNDLIESSPNLIGLYRYEGARRPVDILSSLPGERAYFVNALNQAEYVNACRLRAPLFTLLPTGAGRMRRIVKGDSVSLESAFVPQGKNADYCSHELDFLTEELFYYRNEGHAGFADYSVIGEAYSEGGFMPRVVALHLVHLNEDRDKLFVSHFTSSLDIEGSDTPRKYDSAMGKLLDWADEHPELLRPTAALDTMRDYHEKGRFPGLGVAKKHAIMHHLELVNALLGEMS